MLKNNIQKIIAYLEMNDTKYTLFYNFNLNNQLLRFTV